MNKLFLIKNPDLFQGEKYLNTNKNYDDIEYKFTTYNNAKLIAYDVNNNFINITLKRSYYYLNIKSTYPIGYKLSAPVKGKMEKDILESISSLITVTLKKNNHVIFYDTSTNCGLEIVPK